MNLRHKDLDSTQTEVKAMEDLRDKIKEVFSDEDMAFAYSRFYLGWETNKVMKMLDLLPFSLQIKLPCNRMRCHKLSLVF